MFKYFVITTIFNGANLTLTLVIIYITLEYNII